MLRERGERERERDRVSLFIPDVKMTSFRVQASWAKITSPKGKGDKRTVTAYHPT
jgi:hypothetical protein